MDWLLILHTCGKLIAIYVAALASVRFMGKRALGQLSLFDLVIMAGIGDVIIMVGLDRHVSFFEGMLTLMMLGGLELLFSILVYRSKWMARLLEGRPTLLIKNGVLLEENLAREHLSQSDLKQELRQQGVARLDQVSEAVLEASGKVSVILKDEPELVSDRELLEEIVALRQEIRELKERLMPKEC